jgi:hypothetical protein
MLWLQPRYCASGQRLCLSLVVRRRDHYESEHSELDSGALDSHCLGVTVLRCYYNVGRCRRPCKSSYGTGAMVAPGHLLCRHFPRAYVRALGLDASPSW